MTLKKVRVKILLTAILLVATVILGASASLQIEDNPDYYFLPDNPDIEVKRDGYNYYFNDELLEKKPSSYWEETFLRALPILPLLIPAIVCGIFLILMVKKLPPTYYWKDALGIEIKERHGLISLKQAPSGILAVRRWSLNSNGFLKSTNQNCIWDNLKFEADMIPGTGNWKGIYACRLGTDDGISKFGVSGLVCLTGHIVGHKDGILRAEYCDILLLLVNSEKKAVKLRSHYDCPIVINSNPKQAFINWLISDEGIFWLRHNADIIKNRRKEKFTQDIESILSYQSF